MSEMMGANFQGSFNNKRGGDGSNEGGGPGGQADPKFAHAKNKQSQISTIEQNMMQLNI